MAETSDIEMGEKLADALTRAEIAEARVKELEAENDELLSRRIDRALERQNRRLRFIQENDGSLEMVLTSPSVRILAGSILELFGVFDVKNYIGQTVMIGSPLYPEKAFEIVVRRKAGKTPSEVAGERLAVIDKMFEDLEYLKGYPPPDGRTDEDGYPSEFVYDMFAYRRMVDSYREAIGKTIETAKEGLEGSTNRVGSLDSIPIDQLKDIISEIPTTADGKPVYKGMTLYARPDNPEDDCVETMVSTFWIGGAKTVFDDMDDELNMDEWYSTPEAAKRG